MYSQIRKSKNRVRNSFHLKNTQEKSVKSEDSTEPFQCKFWEETSNGEMIWHKENATGEYNYLGRSYKKPDNFFSYKVYKKVDSNHNSIFELDIKNKQSEMYEQSFSEDFLKPSKKAIKIFDRNRLETLIECAEKYKENREALYSSLGVEEANRIRQNVAKLHTSMPKKKQTLQEVFLEYMRKPEPMITTTNFFGKPTKMTVREAENARRNNHLRDLNSKVYF